MGFEYKDIEVIEGEQVERLAVFIQRQQPVIIRNASKSWPAYEKWTLDYFANAVGNQSVPLYDDSYASASKKVNQADAYMPFDEYINVLKKGPTNLRIFLYNLLKNAAVLQADVIFPKWNIRFIKKLPMLFMGGQGSKVFMHFDIDLANIFHFHFMGRKKCILVPPSQTKYMYKVPFSVICREEIDFDAPDFEKWPLLKNVQPFRCELNHGDCLYMPEGYWHYMHYIDPGASLSLRGIASGKNFLKALTNIFVIRTIDNVCRKAMGKKWMDWKLKQALG